MLRFNCTQHVSFFQYFFCTHRDNICNALIYVKYCTITIVGHTFSSFPASPWRDTELWTVWVQPLWRFDGYFHAAGDSSRRSRCKCAWFCFTSRSLLDALLTLTLTFAMLLFYFTCCCCCCRHGLASSYIDFVPMSFVSLSLPLLSILIYLHIRVRVRLRSRATFEINRNLSPQSGVWAREREWSLQLAPNALLMRGRDREGECGVRDLGNTSQLTQGDTCVNICAAIFCWLFFRSK